MLLGADDPPPFDVFGREAPSPFVIICDHASRRLPRALGSLGLSSGALATHVAWDIGALGVARALASALDAFVAWQRYSRLVIDCNRPLSSADSIVTRSRHELDETKRNQLYRQADSIAFVAAPIVFLYFYDELYAVQPWLKHFVPPVIFNGQRWTTVTIDTART